MCALIAAIPAQRGGALRSVSRKRLDGVQHPAIERVACSFTAINCVVRISTGTGKTGASLFTGAVRVRFGKLSRAGGFHEFAVGRADGILRVVDLAAMSVAGGARVGTMCARRKQGIVGVVSTTPHRVYVFIGVGAKSKRFAGRQALGVLSTCIFVLSVFTLARDAHHIAVMGANGWRVLRVDAGRRWRSKHRVLAMRCGFNGCRRSMHKPTLKRVSVVVGHCVESLAVAQCLTAFCALLKGPVSVPVASARSLVQKAVALAVTSAHASTTRTRTKTMHVRLTDSSCARFGKAAGDGVRSGWFEGVSFGEKLADTHAGLIRRIRGMCSLAGGHHGVAILTTRPEAAALNSGNRLATDGANGSEA